MPSVHSKLNNIPRSALLKLPCEHPSPVKDDPQKRGKRPQAGLRATWCQAVSDVRLNIFFAWLWGVKCKLSQTAALEVVAVCILNPKSYTGHRARDTCVKRQNVDEASQRY